MLLHKLANKLKPHSSDYPKTAASTEHDSAADNRNLPQNEESRLLFSDGDAGNHSSEDYKRNFDTCLCPSNLIGPLLQLLWRAIGRQWTAKEMGNYFISLPDMVMANGAQSPPSAVLFPVATICRNMKVWLSFSDESRRGSKQICFSLYASSNMFPVKWNFSSRLKKKRFSKDFTLPRSFLSSAFYRLLFFPHVMVFFPSFMNQKPFWESFQMVTRTCLAVLELIGASARIQGKKCHNNCTNSKLNPSPQYWHKVESDVNNLNITFHCT